MHKIKELLHKDSEDSNVNTTSTEKHSHSHSHTHGSDNLKEGELSTRQFEENHIKHGEIVHGGETHTHTTHTHEHTLLKTSGERKLKTKKHEKHIIHERETLKDGGDLYRSGVDPAMEREVVSTTSHDGGVTRERIDEGKIVKETIKEVELHKIQPVVHREREQKEIRHVVEPHKKVEIKDTKIHHRERDIDLGVRREASTLETSRSLGSAPQIESSREFLGTERQHQELPTMVEEHVHRKVEEHVHPVIYKEVLKPKVTEETHHIYETVKEAPVETYEVKEIARSRGDGLLEAEREFFSRETSRGMVLTEGHSCSRDVEHSHSHSHKDKSLKTHKIKDKSHKSKKSHKHSGESLKRSAETLVHTHSTGTQEPIIGHHQNIGGHHVAAGAVPAGHNTAYDAALCNQCTDNPICSHSVRDAALMEKANEKKILKDQKLADKQSKNVSVV